MSGKLNVSDIATNLIRKKSITPNDDGCQEYIKNELKDFNFDCVNLNLEDVSNIWLRRGSKKPLVVFAGHTDVVPPGNLNEWKTDPFEAEVIDKFIDLGDEDARMNQYGLSLEALKDVFTSDEDRYKVVKNLAYIARADDFIHENEMAMVEKAVSSLDMVDKVNLVKTDSTLFVDPTF